MARTFNGSSQYATAASSSIYNSTDCTVSLWFNRTANNGRVISVGGFDGSAVVDGWDLACNPANGWLNFYLWSGGTTTIGTNTATLTSGTWYHVVLRMRLTGSELNDFILDDSQQGTDDTTAGRTAAARQLIVANDPSFAQYATGDIAEVSIYNTDLSDAQITSLAGGASPLSATLVGDCVAYWRMDGSGATEDDLVSSITLTYTGTPGTATGPTVDDPPAGGGAPLFAHHIKQQMSN